MHRSCIRYGHFKLCGEERNSSADTLRLIFRVFVPRLGVLVGRVGGGLVQWARRRGGGEGIT
ncbi:hypothetical protein E2C01_088710 [Portunus trituberculatus]|uniref:Uncharacterized protein n=1 Tax=Portunus trituberculatus TaxID=210409 RepID=A0A5B7JH77_PORTR|nr:hypothetical protein [Portunus trituberculatus]